MDGWVVPSSLTSETHQLTPNFENATAVALDTGFATAMHVRPKWLRDILSMLFSGYYLFFAHEADEKVRWPYIPYPDNSPHVNIH